MKSVNFILAAILLLALFAGCNTEPTASEGISRANVNLSTYYANAFGKTGETLRSALKAIITSGHSVTSYTGLWSAYYTTDRTSSGKIWDMYGDNGTGSLPYYSFNYSSDQCGTYRYEGDCYNREHSWPKSWFGEASPMYSDIVHVVPTDGKVNGMRANYAFGEVSSASWTSQNGSKLGSPTSELQGWGCTESTVFEPIDSFKGDFARIYFYMVTRYHGTSESGPMSSNFTLKPWVKNMLLKWHRDDPVSTKEQNRNDGIYTIQGNRNPFVDYPNWVEEIWGDGGSSSSGGSESFSKCTSTSGSYINGSFSGDDVTWYYNYTRWDQTLDGKAPCMGKSTTGKIYSATISGGCGVLTFKFKQTFSTTVNFDVYVNSTKVRTIYYGSGATINTTVNIPGNFVIKFEQNYGGGQATIDSVSWTGCN